MRKTFRYRFLVLFVAFALFGGVFFGALAGGNVLPGWALWTILGCYVGLFIGVVCLNEAIIHKKKRSHS